jgi:hypothetical protein
MKIEIVENEHPITGEITEHVIIYNEDGSYTTMKKSHWDELEAAKENGTIS